MSGILGAGFRLPRGSVGITLLNVYSSLILSAGASSIFLDPVKLDLARLERRADAVVITHEHVDHFDEKVALELQKRSGAAIYTTPFVARRLQRLGGKARGLTKGETVELPGFTLHTEDCLHPANEPLSFIFVTSDATIFHPADSQPFPAMEQIGAKYQPDIMLFFSTPRQSLLRISEMVKPRTVVTYFAPRFADLELPGIAVRMLNQRETFLYP